MRNSKKKVLFLFVGLTFLSCNKDDDGKPIEEIEISPKPTAINYTTETGEPASFQFEYNDMDQLTKIIQTNSSGITTETLEYNSSDKLHKSTLVTPTYTDVVVINYNTEGKVTGIDDGSTTIAVTETPTGFETTINGGLNFYFNEENQIQEISNSSFTSIFTTNTAIGGPFKNVNIERIFYVLHLFELFIYSEEAIVNISNYFVIPNIICIPLEGENGLVDSTEIILDPAQPSITLNFSYL